ncbi:hypothetical protein GCM10010306_008790 [Streptomyces umbrinus]|nr:hypothetical protein GCM10010306_008790 [Streptomyces umbrinus]
MIKVLLVAVWVKRHEGDVGGWPVTAADDGAAGELRARTSPTAAHTRRTVRRSAVPIPGTLTVKRWEDMRKKY